MPRTNSVDLPGCPPFRALCCDNLGYVKVVEVASDKGMPQVVARWGRDPVACSAFGEEGFALARKSGRVEVLNPANGVRLAEVVVPTCIPERGNGNREDGSDAVCGLHLFKKTSIWGSSLLTCTEKGVAAIQRISCQAADECMDVLNVGDEDMGVSTSSQVSASAIIWTVADSGSVLCLRVDGSERFAIFGGKGVDVSMWDLEKRTRIWSAKNPRRDNLGLIAPAFVTALAFLSDKNHHKIVVGTGHHQIRLYDTRAQRRPMLMFDYGESPIKSIAPGGDGNTVFVGTGSGDLACFDMRTGQNVGGFKGKIAGSVRSVVLHPSLPIVASCGLDRYLRIHHSSTRQLLSMLFLKQQLISVVFDTSSDKSVPTSGGFDEDMVIENSNAGGSKSALKIVLETEGRTDKKRSREELKHSATPSQNGVKIKKKNGRASNTDSKEQKSSKKVRNLKVSGP